MNIEISHFVDLRGRGGLELLFSAFLRSTADRLTHRLILKSGPINSHLPKDIPSHADQIVDYRRIGKLKVPEWPKWLRSRLLRYRIRKSQPTIGLIWSHMNALGPAIALKKLGARVFYYEHGGAWISKVAPKRTSFLNAVDGAICNSTAAMRILQLAWNYRGDAIVCPNPLRPDVVPPHVVKKRLTPNRRIQIGMAGRLVSVKGHALGISALALLRNRGYSCELQIAGEGPIEQPLRDWGKKLALSDRIRFRGFVDDMRSFFQDIDIFLCPSIREPFGLVSIEAAAWGCPVVATRVDGLPETLEEGRTGLTVEPSLTPEEFEGPVGHDLPRFVYDPSTDSIRSPLLPDPACIASSIASLLDNPGLFEAMSEAASEFASSRFKFDQYVRRLLAILTCQPPEQH